MSETPASSPPLAAPAREPRRQWILLALILLGAAALRFWHLGAASVWFDELFAITGSTGHIVDWYTVPDNRVIAQLPDLTSPAHAGPWLATIQTPDIHPPLFIILLRIWRDVLGPGDARARSLSAVVSLAAMVLLFDVCRSLFDTRAALWATALMAVAQPQLEAAREVKDYALLLALAMGAMAATARIWKRGSTYGRWTALLACAVAMLLTHYLAVAAMAMLAIWAAAYWDRRSRTIGLWVLGLATAAALAALPWLVRKAQSVNGGAAWLADTRPGHASRLLEQAAMLPSRFLCEPVGGSHWLVLCGAVMFLLPLLLARRRPAMQLCFLWLAGGVGSIVLIDLIQTTDALQFVRYTLIASPAVYMILAGLPLRHSLIRHGLPAAALLGCVLALPQSYETLSNGEWRQLAADVRAHAGAGDLVIFSSERHAFLEAPMNLQGEIEYYDGPLPCPVLLLDQPLDQSLAPALARAKHIWLVIPAQNEASDPFLPGRTLRSVGGYRLYAGRLYEVDQGRLAELE